MVAPPKIQLFRKYLHTSETNKSGYRKYPPSNTRQTCNAQHIDPCQRRGCTGEKRITSSSLLKYYTPKRRQSQAFFIMQGISAGNTTFSLTVFRYPVVYRYLPRHIFRSFCAAARTRSKGTRFDRSPSGSHLLPTRRFPQTVSRKSAEAPVFSPPNAHPPSTRSRSLQSAARRGCRKARPKGWRPWLPCVLHRDPQYRPHPVFRVPF